MTVLKFPPHIQHISCRLPDGKWQELLEAAMKNMRLKSCAKRLMMFYADQANGFRPSLRLIEDKTGIGRLNVCHVRKQLETKGFISYDGNVITIDWYRIWQFSLLDQEQIGKQKDWQIAQVTCFEKNRLHKHIGTLRSPKERQLFESYVATAEAIANGVTFPELKGTAYADIAGIQFDIWSEVEDKNRLHKHIWDDESSKWYDPFKDEDPKWVYQVPVVDAYGEIVAYAHYSEQLPF